MTDIRPWTLKNVPEESRSAAIMAAQRANLTIGEWVARKLLEAAQEDAQASRELVAPASPPVAEPAPSSTPALSQLEQAAAVAAILGALPPGDRALDVFRRKALRALTRTLA